MKYWFYILRNSNTFGFLIVLTLLITLMGLLSPIFIIHIFNRYIAFGLQGTLVFLLVGALSVAIFEFIFRNLRNNIFNKILMNPTKITKLDLMKKFLDFELKNNVKKNFIEIIDFNNNFFNFLSQRNQSNLFDSLFVFLIIVVLFFLNFILASLFIIIVSLYILLQNRIILNKNNFLQNSTILPKDRLIIKEIGSNQELLKSSLAYSYAGFYVDNYFAKKLFVDSMLSSFETHQHSISNFFVLLSSIILIGTGSIFVVMGELTIGSLIGFNIFSSRAIGIITSAHNSYFSLKKIDEYFEDCKKYFDGSKNRSVGMQLSKIEGYIELKNIDFSYDEKRNFLLRNFSVVFRKSKINLVYGSNGSGKTTLAKLLLGLLYPSSGEILIDKTNLEKLSLQWYRKNIAYIPQNPEIISSSIMDNILISNPKLNEQEVSRLLQNVGLDKELKNSNLTITDPVENKISQGVLKRIHIARALAQNPQIFLFDDPFLNLDREGKEIVLKLLSSLRRANKTIICFSEDKELFDISDEKVEIGSW